MLRPARAIFAVFLALLLLSSTAGRTPTSSRSSSHHSRSTLTLRGTWSTVDVAGDPTHGLPAPRHAHTATPLPGGRVLYFGGIGYGSDHATNRSVMYMHHNDAWLLVPRRGSRPAQWFRVQTEGAGAPPPRQSHTAVAWGRERVVVFGGRDTSGQRADEIVVYNDVYVLRLVEVRDTGKADGAVVVAVRGVWHRLDAEAKGDEGVPVPRYGHTAAMWREPGAFADNMVVFGGCAHRDDGSRRFYQELWTLRLPRPSSSSSLDNEAPPRGIWIKPVVSHIRPRGRIGHAAVIFRPKGRSARMVFFGGEMSGDSHVVSRYSEDVWELSLKKMMWRPLSLAGDADAAADFLGREEELKKEAFKQRRYDRRFVRARKDGAGEAGAANGTASPEEVAEQAKAQRRRWQLEEEAAREANRTSPTSRSGHSLVVMTLDAPVPPSKSRPKTTTATPTRPTPMLVILGGAASTHTVARDVAGDVRFGGYDESFGDAWAFDWSASAWHRINLSLRTGTGGRTTTTTTATTTMGSLVHRRGHAAVPWSPGPGLERGSGMAVLGGFDGRCRGGVVAMPVLSMSFEQTTNGTSTSSAEKDAGGEQQAGGGSAASPGEEGSIGGVLSDKELRAGMQVQMQMQHGMAKGGTRIWRPYPVDDPSLSRGLGLRAGRNGASWAGALALPPRARSLLQLAYVELGREPPLRRTAKWERHRAGPMLFPFSWLNLTDNIARRFVAARRQDDGRRLGAGAGDEAVTVTSAAHRRARRYNFIGAIRANAPTTRRRRWILDFAARLFDAAKNDLLVLTDGAAFQAHGDDPANGTSAGTSTRTSSAFGKFDESRAWGERHRRSKEGQHADDGSSSGGDGLSFAELFQDDYFEALVDSNFTLCPGGDAPWSMRFFEAILAGSIPILSEERHAGRVAAEHALGYHFYLPDDEHVYRHDWAAHNRALLEHHQTLGPHNIEDYDDAGDEDAACAAEDAAVMRPQLAEDDDDPLNDF